ncbi:unnamed protein product [Prorocentrum cordatum]|uniref:Bestrophin homolog n=1 Tax=Prorocentrum cordatum TaxID=2364126 RepID=A0ABN9RHX0_9DINO|nr:unnamed protein product [Polarella glacialis]
MIHYSSGSGAPWNHVLNLFQMKGSGFPLAITCAIVPAGVTLYLSWIDMYGDDDILVDNTAWGGFSFLVGFLVVFRTSQAYNRFWDGCTFMHRLQAEWLDACSATIAFTRHSRVDPKIVKDFKHLTVRLFSLLHMFALAYIEGCEELEDVAAHDLELIDPDGIDEDTWNYVRQCRSSAGRVTLVFEWLQCVIVENIKTGVLDIPPPILSRVFQQLANGMVALHDAHKISSIPFPFPYAQTCDAMLVMHLCVTPFVTSSKMSDPWWACLLAFIQVFILWSLNYIAVEIEHPFGGDPNDIDSTGLQLDMNFNLLILLHPACERTPTLSSRAKIHGLVKLGRGASQGLDAGMRTYNQVLSKEFVDADELQPGESSPRASAASASSPSKGRQSVDRSPAETSHNGHQRSSKIMAPSFDDFWNAEPRDGPERPPPRGDDAPCDPGQRHGSGRPPVAPQAPGSQAPPVRLMSGPRLSGMAIGSAAQSQAASSPAVSARSTRAEHGTLRLDSGVGVAPSCYRMQGDHDPEPQSPPQADLQALVPCGSSDGSGASAPAPTMPRLQLQSVAAHVESSPWSFHHQTETISRGSSVVSKDVTLPLP